MIAWWIWVLIGIGVLAGILATYAVVQSRRRAGLIVRHVGDMYSHSPRLDLKTIIPIIHAVLDQKHVLLDDALDRAVKEAVKPGLLLFNVPEKMTQGKQERVEVRIAHSLKLRDEMLTGLRGSGEPQFEEINTSLYMEVKLSGPSFEINSQDPAEQLVIPDPARWDFDVLPCRSGKRQLTLHVNMRIEAGGVVGGRRSVTSLEKRIDVQVNIPYATNRFVAGNWQWLIPTVVTVAGVIAAWLVVPF